MNCSAVTRLLPVCLCALLAPVCASELKPEPQLKGRLHLSGSIVDGACFIQVGNANQTVSLQPNSLHVLVHGAASLQQPLNIYINGCIASKPRRNADKSQTFNLSFEGEGNGKYFNVQGTSKGIALQIKDNQGNLITPGKLLQTSSLTAGSLVLNYSLGLVGNGAPLKAGDYHATLTLSIQHF